MSFACERHSGVQSMKIHCLSLLFTKTRMELLVGRFFGLGTGSWAVGVLRSTCCCGAETSVAGEAGAGKGSAVTKPGHNQDAG